MHRKKPEKATEPEQQPLLKDQKERPKMDAAPPEPAPENPETTKRKLLKEGTDVDKSTPRLPGGVMDLILDYAEEGTVDKDQKVTKSSFFNKRQDLVSLDELHTGLMLPKLLGHVINGEVAQAEAILKIEPALLFNKSNNTHDLFGNEYVHYSPCELAFYTHDQAMLEMMQRCIDEMPDNVKAKEDFAAIGKAAADEMARQRKHPLKFDPMTLIIAISTPTIYFNPNKIEELLEKFRAAYGPRKIENEKSFNINEVLAMYHSYYKRVKQDAYQEQGMKDGLWSNNQFTFLWTKGVGYMQRTLPISYMRDLGLPQTPDDKKNPENPKKESELGFSHALCHYISYSGKYPMDITSIPSKEGPTSEQIVGDMRNFFLKVWKTKSETIIKYSVVHDSSAKPKKWWKRS